MKNIKTSRLPLLLLAWFAIPIAAAQSSFVLGPIESVSANLEQLTVLGQTYVIDSETKFSSGSKSLNGMAASRALQLGTLVAIEGSNGAPLAKATSVVLASKSYVAGATPVFIGGIATSVSFVRGTVTVGGVTIDVSATDPHVLSNLKVGSYVELSGIQPLPHGLLLLDKLNVVDPALTSSIGGTGAALQSIGGTGKSVSLQGIGGTGTSASVQSIGGTGKSAAAQSIGGTGKGISVQSIGGTGAGSSLESIGGTGKNLSVQSIGGTGKSAPPESIGGTGTSVSLQSIGGTGKNASVQSIGGTGTGNN